MVESAVGSEHEVRYQLLETVRAYAADRLAEAGEEHQARAAHAEFFLALAERAEPELRGAYGGNVSSRPRADDDNVEVCINHNAILRDSGNSPR